jgi:hypothetical protein
MRLDPNNPEIRYSAARFSLREGWFKPGWELYESRWRVKSRRQIFEINSLPAPRWRGQSLAGKTLLIWDDHGLGDSIQMIRYTPPLLERTRSEDGKIVFLCRPPLLDLYQRSLQDERLLLLPLSKQAIESDVRFDFHCPLTSLTLYVCQESVPPLVPLIPDPEKSTRWQEQLASEKGLKVGIAWTGRPDHLRNHKRSFAPGELAGRIKDVPGITLYSLQKDQADQSRDAGLIDVTDQFHSFDDTAACIAGGLDLVISCDGVVAHLAGSLNVPVLVALDLNPHWAWGRQGLITPWYGSAKLFRQKSMFDWSNVFREIREDLIALVDRRLHD